MRAAKERKRIARSSSLRDVGGLVTDGCLGNHVVRLMAFADGERLAVVVDGQQRRARTYRGILMCMAEMVFSKMSIGAGIRPVKGSALKRGHTRARSADNRFAAGCDPLAAKLKGGGNEHIGGKTAY
jgi:hypothetical protein